MRLGEHMQAKRKRDCDVLTISCGDDEVALAHEFWRLIVFETCAGQQHGLNCAKQQSAGNDLSSGGPSSSQ